MEKADETTNVNEESSFIDPDKDLSIQGGVEMNNATPLEGSSVFLENKILYLMVMIKHQTLENLNGMMMVM
jgi:hypothetical protein